MNKKVLAFGLSMTLCASITYAEELFVSAEKVIIRSGTGAIYPEVANAKKGTSLTVVSRQGKWILVQAASESGTVKGYVFENALSPNKPSGDLVAGITVNSGVADAEAGKGLGPDATAYANSKNMDPKPLDGLIAFRKKIDVKEFLAFTSAGKVGPAKSAN